MVSIRLPEKFEVGRFLERINRFMVRVELNEMPVLAHLPNSGRLSTVLLPKSKAFLLERDKPERKSRFDLFAIERKHVPIIVDTRFSNYVAKKAIELKAHEQLEDYKVAKEDIAVNNSQLDILLQNGVSKFFLEVKSVTHVIDHVASFPDAPTLRGRRHLQHLTELVKQCHKAGILFSVQRPDAKALRPNREVDPEFALLLEKALGEGVQVFVQTLVFGHGKNETVEIKPDVPKIRI